MVQEGSKSKIGQIVINHLIDTNQIVLYDRDSDVLDQS